MSKLYFFIGVSFIFGIYFGSLYQKGQASIYQHGTIYRNGTIEKEYYFSNFLYNSHKYGLYIRDNNKDEPISIIIGKSDGDSSLFRKIIFSFEKVYKNPHLLSIY